MRTGSPQAAVAERDPAPTAEDVSNWLVEKGLEGGTIEELFEGYCTRLAGLGLPVWRAHIAMRTLHPTYGSQAFTWIEGKGVERVSFLYTKHDSPEFLRSPYHWMLERERTFARWRLAGPEASQRFLLFDELRAEGATDYMSSIVGFGDDGVIDGRLRFLASYSSRDRRGFSDEDIAALILYLAGDGARHITGTAIAIDGGDSA